MKLKHQIRIVSCGAAALLLATLNHQLSTAFAQGSLTPPGAPAPTMKTLAQIEPRIPISSLPFTINNPGSYYLTTNLTGTSGFNGVTISADNVTLDLNGFAIVGTPGALAGAVVSGSHRNIALRNGTIRNWPGNGLDFSTAVNTALADLRVSNNGGAGLIAGNTGTLVDCIARDNTGDGIRTGDHNSLTRCASIANTAGHGFLLSGYSVATDCTAQSNGLNGMDCGGRTILRNCVASFNGQNGVHMNFSGVVSGCLCDGNGFSGIMTDSGGYMQALQNLCIENGTSGTNHGAGIRLAGSSGGNRVEGNNLGQNYFGLDAQSTRNVIFSNIAVANTSGTNYNLAAGNTYGPIINAAGVGDITGIANANHPKANFIY